MSDFLVLLGIYVVLGTLIAVLVRRRRQSQEQYFLGGRMIGGLVSAGTYAATTYSAFMMVGLVGLTYATGIGATLFELCYLAGTLILLATYGRRIWEMGRSKGLVSPMELFTQRYGRLTAGAGTVIALVALIPYTASQVIGLGLIFQSHGALSFTLGAAVAAVVIAVWALIGGLRGVAVTDTLQGAFMFAVAVAAVVWTRGRFPGLEPQSFPNAFWTPVRFVDLTLPWIFFALTNPQVLQRLFIPRDGKAFNRLVWMFALFGLLYTLLVSFLGFSARWGTAQGLFPAVADRDRVILELLSRMRRGLSLALALSIVFAAVTTANSIILSLSSMVSRDLFPRQHGLWLGRGLIGLLTALVFLFSLARPAYIVELSVASSTILLCYLPLLFGLFHGRRGGELAGLLTLLAGSSAAILLAVLRVPLRSVYTLGVSFLAYFVGLGAERLSAGRLAKRRR